MHMVQPVLTVVPIEDYTYGSITPICERVTAVGHANRSIPRLRLLLQPLPFPCIRNESAAYDALSSIRLLQAFLFTSSCVNLPANVSVMRVLCM
jgi:hypothetical protein